MKKYIIEDPALLAEWDYEKNEELGLAPDFITVGSNLKVWWKCDKGHSYDMSVHKKSARSIGSCPVCSGHRTVPGVNDFATCYPSIADEWHPTKNGDLKPFTLSKKNGRKVWWQCQYGHEWQATIHDRADGTGCPECAKRSQTSFYEQAIYYYVKKLYPDAVNRYRELFDNGMELDVFIPSIKLGIEFDGANWHKSSEEKSREKVKYRICEDNKITLIRVKETTDKKWHGVSNATYYIRRKNKNDLQEVIQAIMDSIDPVSNMWTRKNPIHIHSDIKVDLERDANEIREYLGIIPNSLAELRPDLVKDWNYEKNGNLKPEMFGINSNDYVWWKCSICGHEWRTTIIHRGGKRKSACPECAKISQGKSFTKRRVQERGSLADNNPELAKQWHPTLNGDLKPSDITEKRFKPVWWLCPVCGHEWQSSPNNRSKGVGCPCCSGRVPKIGVNDLKTKKPEIAAEWNYEKNGDLRPECFLPGSSKKVWWKCSICGNEWEAVISQRTRGSGCPNWRHH